MACIVTGECAYCSQYKSLTSNRFNLRTDYLRRQMDQHYHPLPHLRPRLHSKAKWRTDTAKELHEWSYTDPYYRGARSRGGLSAIEKILHKKALKNTNRNSKLPFLTSPIGQLWTFGKRSWLTKRVYRKSRQSEWPRSWPMENVSDDINQKYVFCSPQQNSITA